MKRTTKRRSSPSSEETAQNTSVLITSIILGYVKDATGSYSVPITILVAYAFGSLLFGMALYMYDRKCCNRRLELLRDRKEWVIQKKSSLRELEAEATSAVFQ